MDAATLPTWKGANQKDYEASVKSGQIVVGKFLGYCPGCELMMGKMDKRGTTQVKCGRCGKTSAIKKLKKELPRKNCVLGGYEV